MSKIISAAGAINNAIENNEKLKFAKYNLDKDMFEKIYDGYKKAKYSQLALPIIFAIIVILELILIPSSNVPNGQASFKETLIIFETVFFIIPILPIWLIFCNYTFGKNWSKFCKWYNKDANNINELYDKIK